MDFSLGTVLGKDSVDFCCEVPPAPFLGPAAPVLTTSNEMGTVLQSKAGVLLSICFPGI